MTDFEGAVAEFARTLSLEDVPAAVVQRAKNLLLDQIGVQIACVRLPWVGQLRDYVERTYAEGPCTILGSSHSVGPEGAALANGTSGHGFEADDFCAVGSAHAGCVVAPSAMAVCEHVGATGRDLLTAFIAGAELVVRLSRASMPSMLYERGFHETCAHGVFASAMAAGRILGLSQSQMVDALGIAGSHASGTTEFVRSGGDVKRLHGGLGAAGGIRGAYLADLGYTGPARILTGDRGFLKAFSPHPDPRWLVDGLGEDWQLQNLIIKRYCCAGRIIPQVEALNEILERENLEPAAVANIKVGMDSGGLKHAAQGPAEALRLDATTAQFSTEISLGLTLAKRANGFEDYWGLLREGRLTDPDVLEAAAKVEPYVDLECDAAYPGAMMCRVSVETIDGRTYRADGLVDRDHQPDESAVRVKFREMTRHGLAGDVAERLASSIMNVEELPAVAQLAGLLGTSPAAVDSPS